MFKLQIKDSPQKSIWLVGPYVTVGRAKSNSLVVDVPGVESLHAEFAVDGETIFITDKSGDQSVIVNGRQVDQKLLIKHGDVITLNTVELELVDPKVRGQVVRSTLATEDSGVKQARRLVKRQPTGWQIQTRDTGGLQIQTFDIGESMILGRDKQCDISFPGDFLSRRHAELTVRGSLLYIKDLNSSNGTFVNGIKVTKTLLRAGDNIKFDELSFIVIGPAAKSGHDHTQLRDGKHGGPVEQATIIQTEPSLIPKTKVSSIHSLPTQASQPLTPIPRKPHSTEPRTINDAAPVYVESTSSAETHVVVKLVEELSSPRKLNLDNKLLTYAFVASVIVAISFATLYIFK